MKKQENKMLLFVLSYEITLNKDMTVNRPLSQLLYTTKDKIYCILGMQPIGYAKEIMIV